MMIFDVKCENEDCNDAGKVLEMIMHSSKEPPKCDSCGVELAKQISTVSFKIGGAGVHSQGFKGKKR